MLTDTDLDIQALLSAPDVQAVLGDLSLVTWMSSPF
jgi:hypothetical protein